MAIGRVPGATGIQPSIVDAKGDLIVATAADSVSRLAVGANNTVLTADSAETTGLKWAAPASGGMTLLATTTLSSTTTTVSSISQDYVNLLVLFRGVHASGGSFGIRFNGITTSSYVQNTDEVGNGLAFSSVWAGDTQFNYTENIGSDNQNCGFIWIYDYANLTPFEYTQSKIYSDAGDDILGFQGVLRNGTAEGVSSITYFSPSGGTIGGTALLYGVK